MARRRRDEPLAVERRVSVRDYLTLVRFAMASEDGELSRRILAEADRLGYLGLTLEERFAALRKFIGGLGYGQAADRHVAHLRAARRPIERSTTR